jgi:hypothetical protein
MRGKGFEGDPSAHLQFHVKRERGEKAIAVAVGNDARGHAA